MINIAKAIPKYLRYYIKAFGMTLKSINYFNSPTYVYSVLKFLEPELLADDIDCIMSFSEEKAKLSVTPL